MRITTAIGTFLAIVLFAGSANAAMSSFVTVDLHAQNKSGESGIATLTQMSNGIKVVVHLSGAPAAAQPAHIHAGTCADLGAVKYPLKNLENGKSTSIITGIKLGDIEGGKFAINVHKSTNDLKTYVSCGEIK